MQFYTFLETAVVTLSLLPYFIAFFTGGELPGTPGTLAATFITFGKFWGWPNLFLYSHFYFLFFLTHFSFSHSVLNLAFSLSVMGFMIMHLSLVAANTTTIEVMALSVMLL